MGEVVQADLVIPQELGAVRLDQAMAQLMPEHSRSRIQDWIKAGALLVNGQQRKPRDKVMVGDQISLNVTVEAVADWQAEQIDLNIVFEDEHLLVVNKPAGLVVHPAAGHDSGTLLNALLHHCPDIDHLPRAGIVHRLDKDTTGIMVVAKTLVAHTSLVEQLQERTMGREYEAVVQGEMTGGGKVAQPMARHPKNRQKMAVVPNGKPALTHYRVLERFAGFTHVRLKLETGRTHQIRVHMSHINYPLVGDPLYGGRMRLPKGATEMLQELLRQFRRQALHAKRLELRHPVSGETLEWEVPLPDDLNELLTVLRQEAPYDPLGN